MAAIQQQVIGVALKDPAVASVGAYIGAGGATSTENQGRIFIALKPKQQRAPIMAVIGRLDKAASSVMGVRLFMQPVQDINIGGRLTATQYQYTLADIDATRAQQVGTDHPERAGEAAADHRPGERPTIRGAAAHAGDQPRQRLAPGDRCGTDRLGAVRRLRAATDLATVHQPEPVLRDHGGEARLPARARRPATDLCRSQTAGMVPLSELVTQHTTLAPLSVNHQGQFPSVTLSFNLKANAPLGPAVAAINQAMQSLHVPPTIQATFQGNAQAFQASLSSTPILIVAALIAVYIILGMLYENHDPSLDHHFDPAVGRRRRIAGVAAVRLRPGRNGDHRHHPADRHREEEWHHAGRLRSGGGTASGPDTGASDL